MSSILYRDETASIFLLDIPLSIADAQGWPNGAARRLLSSEPLQRPFIVPEPKSEERKRAMSLDEAFSELHRNYVNSIELAVKDIKHHFRGDWCAPRRIAPGAASRKRKAADLGSDAPGTKRQAHMDSADSMQGSERVRLPDNLLKELSCHGPQLGTAAPTQNIQIGYCRLDSSPAHEAIDATKLQSGIMALSGVTFQNPHTELLRATVSASDCSFLIPSASVAVLADCSDSANFLAALVTSRSARQTCEDTARKFDLILLDPPWPNRSARRRGSYEVQYGLRDTDELLRGMDLDLQLAAGGFIAVWITNKPAVRNLVLGSEGDGSPGWFASLGVELVEEWIWIKTTAQGEPVSAIDAVWRRPYEVLLVGKEVAASSFVVTNKHVVQPKRRIIAAVPDLHSRKPCLKSLFRDLLFNGRQFSGLEVFARHMVEGWWSWGDEAIKFNWEGYWR